MDDLQRLVKTLRSDPLWVGDHGPVPDAAADLHALLPHRPPFLLIDGIDGVDIEQQTIRGRRWLMPDDPVFSGHFPGHPVYPGVLQIEIMGQLALCLAGLMATATPDGEPPRIFMTKVRHAEFFEPLRPNDRLTIHAAVVDDDGLIAVTAGQIYKESTMVAFCVQEGCYVD